MSSAFGRGSAELGSVAPIVEVPPWLGLGRMIVDRDPRPAFMLDSAGHVCAANQPLLKARGVSGESLVGLGLKDLWPLDCPGKQAVDEAIKRARTGEVARVTLAAETRPGEVAISLFEVVALQNTSDAPVVVSVLATESAKTAPPFRPANGLHYEIEGSPSFRLLHVTSSSEDELRAAPADACYRALRGLTRPCDGCPVLLLDPGPHAEARSLLPGPPGKLHLKVAHARRTNAGRVAVSTFDVNDQLLSLLIAAKTDRLAKQASLSQREQSVFDLLLLGRSHTEIGDILGITPRTVKYHQGRVQQKLGVDSRLDLLRIIL
jgi:DNA-binding CsgD family transcriptional regulator